MGERTEAERSVRDLGAQLLHPLRCPHPGLGGFEAPCGSGLAAGWIRTQELDCWEFSMEVAQAVRDHFVLDVSFQVQHEAVVSESRLGGPRLEPREVDRARGELLEDRQQASGSIGVLVTDHACSIVAGRHGYALAGEYDKTGLVAGVILYVRGRHLQAVKGGRKGWGDRSGSRVLGLGKRPCGVGRGLGGKCLNAGEAVRYEVAALGESHGIGQDLVDLVELDTGPHEEVEVDVQDDLGLDEQVVVEYQAVQGGVDAAFDGVLDRHESEGRTIFGRGDEHLFERAHCDLFQLGQGGIREECLLGECSRRAQIGDLAVGREGHAGQDSKAMDEPALRQLIDDVRTGLVSPDSAVSALRRLPFADLGSAKVDHHRYLRQGIAEAVYAPGKTSIQCADIVAELLSEPSGGPVLLTRADPDQAEAALEMSPGGVVSGSAAKGCSTISWRHAGPREGRVAVVTAGTADLGVAAEAVATLSAYGFEPQLLADCGVAGMHRVLSVSSEIQDAEAVIVVAGMEGALASIVGGMAPGPVVAVPTSVGYGAALEGVTALLAMLSSCAAGITVVGIDNGFGAACAVARMLP